MTQALADVVHRYVAGTDPSRPPLLLLHGTGGNEDDLIGLGAAVAPGAALLSPRGQVLENGMPRFFRRLADGVFDEADLERRAAELARFIADARTAYTIPAPMALGFSNGANMAAALLLLHPESLAGAVLLRGMAPLSAAPSANLAGKPVLLLSGSADTMIPAAKARRLAEELTARGAAVDHTTVPGAHGLSTRDVDLAQDWLARHTGASPT